MDRDHGRLLEQNDRWLKEKCAAAAAALAEREREGGGIDALKLPFKNARVLVKLGLEKLCIAALFYANRTSRVSFPFTSAEPARSLVISNQPPEISPLGLLIAACALNRP